MNEFIVKVSYSGKDGWRSTCIEMEGRKLKSRERMEYYATGETIDEALAATGERLQAYSDEEVRKQVLGGPTLNTKQEIDGGAR